MDFNVIREGLVHETSFVSTNAGRTPSTYLNKKWQKHLDELTDRFAGAHVVLWQVTASGYKIGAYSTNCVACYDLDRLYPRGNGDFADVAYDYGRMVTIGDASSDIRFASSMECAMGIKTMLGMPIYDYQDEIVAILAMLYKEENRMTYDVLESFRWLGLGMEESVRFLRLEAELGRIRNIDPLTRLISKEEMIFLIKSEFERSGRSDIPFSLIVLDLDRFSDINDKFGYEIGDMVLKSCSEEIAKRIRRVDTACRWQDDTFIILCPQTELIGANALVNDLFVTLNQHHFPHVGHCSFSVGIADYMAEDHSVNDLMLRLDKALYRVKAFGGNSYQARYH